MRGTHTRTQRAHTQTQTPSHTHAPSASCARKRSARAANGVVVGCSPPRESRDGECSFHQGGGWLIDRTRFSTRPAEPRHSFHPEPADPLGRACSPAGRQPKDQPREEVRRDERLRKGQAGEIAASRKVDDSPRGSFSHSRFR